MNINKSIFEKTLRAKRMKHGVFSKMELLLSSNVVYLIILDYISDWVSETCPQIQYIIPTI